MLYFNKYVLRRECGYGASKSNLGRYLSVYIKRRRL